MPCTRHSEYTHLIEPCSSKSTCPVPSLLAVLNTLSRWFVNRSPSTECCIDNGSNPETDRTTKRAKMDASAVASAAHSRTPRSVQAWCFAQASIISVLCSANATPTVPASDPKSTLLSLLHTLPDQSLPCSAQAGVLSLLHTQDAVTVRSDVGFAACASTPLIETVIAILVRSRVSCYLNRVWYAHFL